MLNCAISGRHKTLNRPVEVKSSAESALLAVCGGLARLIEGQRRFSVEFGLPHSRVFSHEAASLGQTEFDQVLLGWLTDKEEGQKNLSGVLHDLIAHQLALHGALDGVAKESLEKLSPASIRSRTFSLFGWRPFAWLSYRRLHRSYRENDYLRHQELIVSGFVKEYIAYRNRLATPLPVQ